MKIMEWFSSLVKKSEEVYPLDTYVNKKVFHEMKELKEHDKKVIFVGSLPLILLGLLDRQIGDIDIVTSENYYSPYGVRDIFWVTNRISTPQRRSLVGKGKWVFNLQLATHYIDVIYHERKIPYKNFEIQGEVFRLATVDSIIKHKLEHLEHTPKIENFFKHIRDLTELHVDNDIINDVISRANFVA